MSKYLDVIPKIRIYEKKLLDKGKIDRIIEFNNIGDVFKFLSETTYGSNTSDGINEVNYEEVLSLELNRLFANISDVCRDQRLMDIFTIKYKYNNLKILLKSRFLNVNLDDALFELDSIDNEKLYNAINNDILRDLDASIYPIVNDLINEFQDSNDYKKIDFILDKRMFADLKDKAIDINDKFMIEYINILIDVFNLKSIFRMRKLGLDKKIFDDVIGIVGTIPLNKLQSIFLDSKENIMIKFSNIDVYKYIKNGLEKFISHDEIHTLELELDNYVMEFLKNGKIITSGLAPIIGYINAKESELRNIRFIITSKLNNVPPEFIKRRLIFNYV